MRALTHRSYIDEFRIFLQADNERLEFLGDAVIDFIVGELLYHRYPEMREGNLTNLRAALVREETLAILAGRLRLGEVLLLGRGESESGGRGTGLLFFARPSKPSSARVTSIRD